MITLSHGASEINISNISSLVGKTISQLKEMTDIKNMLSLSGDEVVKVSVDGGDSTTVDNNYVVKDNSVIEFTKVSGTKG